MLAFSRMLLYWQGCRNENPVAAVASLIPQLHPLVLLFFCSLPLSEFSYPIYFSKKWSNNLLAVCLCTSFCLLSKEINNIKEKINTISSQELHKIRSFPIPIISSVSLSKNCCPFKGGKKQNKTQTCYLCLKCYSLPKNLGSCIFTVC